VFEWVPWRRKRREEEIGEEIQYHLAMLAREAAEDGRAAQEAAFAARRKLGNRTLIQENLHEMWSWRTVEAMWQDLRYAARMLRINRGFTAAAVLSLALGIGANTALFQLLDALVLRTLPVRDPQNIVRLDYAGDPGRSGHFLERPDEFTNPQWEQMRAHHDVFSGVFAWTNTEFNLAPAGEARLAKGIVVSGEFFPVLGVDAELGRLLSAADDQRGCASPRAVLSYGFWQSEFGGDKSILGREIRLNGVPLQVAGVTQAEFTGLDVGRRFDIAAPICAAPMLFAEDTLNARATWWLGVMGRLKPGVSLRQSSAYLSALWPQILHATADPAWRAETAKEYFRLRIQAEPGATGVSTLRSQVERPLLLLFSIAVLVLLIACANLANLLLARATAREGEIAIRLAIGASRWRLVRQLMTESLLLAVAGAAAGALLGQFVSRYLLSLLATTADSWTLNLGFDWRTFVFLTGTVTLACTLFGLAPAVRATRRDTSSSMKGSSRQATATRERFSAQRLLVIAQISLSMILLVGSLLFVRSFRNLMTLDPGFRQDGLVAVWMDLDAKEIAPDKRMQHFHRVLDSIRGMPGIDSAAMVEEPPLEGGWSNDRLTVDNKPDKSTTKVRSNVNQISPEYFRTMAMPLIAGRDFEADDTLSSPRAAIVDQMFVSNILRGRDPLKTSFHFEAGPGEKIEHFQIVGVVTNAKYSDLRKPLSPTIYLDEDQNPSPHSGQPFVVRSRLGLASALSEIRAAVAKVEPRGNLQFRGMRTLIHDSVRREDVMAKLSSIFGLLAVVLATVGLYGVMSYIVAQRRKEIGVRMAIGANKPDIIRLMLRHSIVMLGVGLSVGTLLSLAAARTAKSLLFGLEPNDPATVALAILSLTLVTALATLIPARRAAALDPMTALREE
jgi:putative ABC transport system permease protein